MPSPTILRVPLEDIDSAALPTSAGDLGTPDFATAISDYVTGLVPELGGTGKVSVEGNAVVVVWTPGTADPTGIQGAVAALQERRLREGAVLLQLLSSAYPDSPPVLYNLGMVFSDLGQLDAAERPLRQLVTVAPNNADGHTALGVALARQGKPQEALVELRESVRLDPNNPHAQRNLGGALLRAGKLDEALDHLQRATELAPLDQRAWIGLGKTCEALDQRQRADEAYRRALSIDSHNELGEEAHSGLRRLAEHTFRERGGDAPRPDAIFYCLDALERFDRMSEVEIQQVTGEIAFLGADGLDVNNPDQRYQLKRLSGDYSGLQLVCILYVGLKHIAPDQDIGFDLSREYAAAISLHESGHPTERSTAE